jgi:predicted transcriptional regulator
MSTTALSRSTDPSTSQTAAVRIKGTELEAVVLAAVEALGTATYKEVASYTGRQGVTVSPRFRPLARRGLIQATGERRDGCRVWRAA